MEEWQRVLIGVATIAGMILIIPLMVWGGSGDWRRGLEALRDYLMIMGGLVAIGGGFGLLMAFAEHGFAIFRVFGF